MTRKGGPEVLEVIEAPEPVPAAGEALVGIAAAGVNFMDTGVRRGLAWTERPDPKVLGVEGAGRILAVGAGVEGVKPGDRVAWFMPLEAMPPQCDPGQRSGSATRRNSR